MAKGELIKFITSKVGELVISGHSIAVKFRRDFIEPPQIILERL